MALRNAKPTPETWEKCVYCGTEPQWRYQYRENSFPGKYRPYCHRHAFWFELVDRIDRPIKGTLDFVLMEKGEIYVYSLRSPHIDWESPRSTLGYGGAWWKINANNKDYFTNNLWWRGMVPEDMRGSFYTRINTHELRPATPEEIRSVAEGRY